MQIWEPQISIIFTTVLPLYISVLTTTSFHCHFTFALRATEAVSNVYKEEELFNFALNDLQLDCGSTYMLADIKTKFFTIDKKVARVKMLTNIATSNMASRKPSNLSRSTKPAYYLDQMW